MGNHFFLTKKSRILQSIKNRTIILGLPCTNYNKVIQITQDGKRDTHHHK